MHTATLRPITLAVEAWVNLVLPRESHLVVQVDPEAEEYITACGAVYSARLHSDEPVFAPCPECSA